jgi:hypothetical protein
MFDLRISKHGYAAKAAVVATLAVSSSSLEPQPSAGSMASGGSAGVTGGTSAGSGGNRAAGGTGGGTTGSGGSGATGGSSGSSLESRALTACSNWQANGFVLGCSAVFGGTYVADCQAELVSAAQSCAVEVGALLDCGTMRSALDYACDASGDVTFAAGVCESETSALDQCLQ